jgi:protein SCO1/2
MVKRPHRSAPKKDSKATLAFAGVASLLLLLSAAYLWLLGGGRPPPSVRPIGGSFSLNQDAGRVVTDRDFRGQYMLIYFGYAHCADVCPMTLSAIADALAILGNRASDLRAIFITVDPKRDTPAIARAYTGKFSPRILGLSGTPEEIQAVERTYHVRGTIIAPAGDSSMADYTMGHTATLFLVGPDGRSIAPLSGLEGGELLARQLAEYLPVTPVTAAREMR